MYLGVYLGVLSPNSPLGIRKLFTTGKSHAPAHIYGMGVGFWTLVAPHPQVTFRGSSTSATFNLPFTPFISLTCLLLFLRIIMEVKLTVRLITEVFWWPVF